MKRILITGANSYIGTFFENYVKQWPEEYHVDTIDMIDGFWRERSFAGYDAVFHVAGIAHIKETKKNALLYYTVNCDLAIETARKARAEGVKQFIFLSFMSVYGMETGAITKETRPTPKTNYGKSKLEAEKCISELADQSFLIAILRPPVGYGKGCKGNYRALAKYARKLPVFPYVENERSMLQIENLAEFVRLIVEDTGEGLFWPQNREYVNTSLLVKEIAAAHGKRIKLMKGFGWLIKMGGGFVSRLNKAFGSLTYDMRMSKYNIDYWKYSFEASIKATERTL